MKTSIQLIAVGSTRWQRFVKRWGVAFLIGRDVLFDTFGDPRVFMNNMRRWRIDQKAIRHIVISHDHWDHTSGLAPFMKVNRDAAVYGCLGTASFMKDAGRRALVVKAPLEIAPGVYATGPLYGQLRLNSIYEQSLVLESERGLCVVCGCAHPGIEKIVAFARRHFNAPVHAVIGGLHLKDCSQDRIHQTVDFLRKSGVRKVAPMHCTGNRAVWALKKEYRGDFLDVREGESIAI